MNDMLQGVLALLGLIATIGAAVQGALYIHSLIVKPQIMVNTIHIFPAGLEFKKDLIVRIINDKLTSQSFYDLGNGDSNNMIKNNLLTEIDMFRNYDEYQRLRAIRQHIDTKIKRNKTIVSALDQTYWQIFPLSGSELKALFGTINCTPLIVLPMVFDNHGYFKRHVSRILLRIVDAKTRRTVYYSAKYTINENINVEFISQRDPKALYKSLEPFIPISLDGNGATSQNVGFEYVPMINEILTAPFSIFESEYQLDLFAVGPSNEIINSDLPFTVHIGDTSPTFHDQVLTFAVINSNFIKAVLSKKSVNDYRKYFQTDTLYGKKSLH